MTPLSRHLLELDREACALAQICGRSERGKQIRERVKAVRRAAAEVRIADLAAHPNQVEPAEAIRTVIENAMRAGMEFPAIAGVVNSVSERDCGMRS